MKCAIIGASKLLLTEKISEADYYSFGTWCAKRGFSLLTGACQGIPYVVGRGCIENGGICIGFSPAVTQLEHTAEYLHPLDGCSEIRYYSDKTTDFNTRFILRSIPMIEMADCILAFNGSWGTMSELILGIFSGKKIILCGDSGGAAKAFQGCYLRLKGNETYKYDEEIIFVDTIDDVKKVLI